MSFEEFKDTLNSFDRLTLTQYEYKLLEKAYVAGVVEGAMCMLVEGMKAYSEVEKVKGDEHGN